MSHGPERRDDARGYDGRSRRQRLVAFTFDFHFLQADATRDRVVSLLDFNALAGNFGISGAVFTQGDFNYDTIVDLQDFSILAGRFGAGLSMTSPGSIFDSAARPQSDTVDDSLRELLG